MQLHWPEQVCWCLIPKGEGCVALQAAQFCYTEFQITLTHHGEKTGTLTGGIQLRTSVGKSTEKLYGESENQLRIYLLKASSTSVLVAPILILLCFQILSKLKKMTLLPQKAKSVTQTSKIFFHLWLLQNISHTTPGCDNFLSFGLGSPSHKHMIFLTPVTWECPSKRAVWSIKAGVTACHQKIFPLLDKGVKSPRRVVMMWAHAVPL